MTTMTYRLHVTHDGQTQQLDAPSFGMLGAILLRIASTMHPETVLVSTLPTVLIDDGSALDLFPAEGA